MQFSDTLLPDSSVENKSIWTCQTEGFSTALRLTAITTQEIDWSRAVMCRGWIQATCRGVNGCSIQLSIPLLLWRKNYKAEKHSELWNQSSNNLHYHKCEPHWESDFLRSRAVNYWYIHYVCCASVTAAVISVRRNDYQVEVFLDRTVLMDFLFMSCLMLLKADLIITHRVWLTWARVTHRWWFTSVFMWIYLQTWCFILMNL